MLLSDWMTDQGLDDAQVAAMVGVDRATISRIRRRTYAPSGTLLLQLKTLTNGAVTADDLLPEPSQVEAAE